MTNLRDELSNVISLGELAVDFAARVLESERKFVASAWLDPIAGHNAAYKHELFGDRFADTAVGLVYAYVMACVDHVIRPSLDQCMYVGRRESPPVVFDVDWLYRLIMDSNTCDGRCDGYAKQVADFAGIRARTARHHLSEAAKMMVDQDRFEVVVRERQPKHCSTSIPIRLRNGARHYAKRYSV